MNNVRALLDQFWVTRLENRDLYFALKRAQPEYRRLVSELLGWNLIVNESVVKLEKIPPKGHALDGNSNLSGTHGLLPAVRSFAVSGSSGQWGALFALFPHQGDRDISGGDQTGGLDAVSAPQVPGAGPPICPGDRSGGGL